MDGSGLAVFTAKTNVGSSGLKIGEVAATGYLQPFFLSGGPYFEVVLLGMRKTDVAGAD